jgi:hypothetical protein
MIHRRSQRPLPEASARSAESWIVNVDWQLSSRSHASAR